MSIGGGGGMGGATQTMQRRLPGYPNPAVATPTGMRHRVTGQLSGPGGGWVNPPQFAPQQPPQRPEMGGGWLNSPQFERQQPTQRMGGNWLNSPQFERQLPPQRPPGMEMSEGVRAPLTLDRFNAGNSGDMGGVRNPMTLDRFNSRFSTRPEMTSDIQTMGTDGMGNAPQPAVGQPPGANMAERARLFNIANPGLNASTSGQITETSPWAPWQGRLGAYDAPRGNGRTESRADGSNYWNGVLTPFQGNEFEPILNHYLPMRQRYLTPDSSEYQQNARLIPYLQAGGLLRNFGG